MIKPINNSVILDFVDTKSISQHDSGLTIVSNDGLRKPITTIVAVPDLICESDGTWKTPYFQPGDRVIFNRGNATEFEWEDKKYLACPYSEIFAVVSMDIE